ncbi:MAG: hypothetical protein LQ346_002558 [Caloplaca aetnensis]|nr:MAG: hypothetical protein LQ346_002558 [Caloplaca aetnensis]
MAETFDYHDFDPSENIRPALLDLGIPHDEEDVHYQETTQNKDFKGLNGLSYVPMASFFDNKARAAAAASAAANGASSSTAAAPKETQNLQPWVEK